MRAALLLSRYGLGRTAPNPSVGCVLVKDGVLVGRGRTADGGRPHAETEALSCAKHLAKGATAYVTLEPCAHHGQTPPCAAALIKAGVARVVIAAPDPDARVAGAGVTMLRDAGVEVTEGVLQTEAEAVLAGYLTLRRLRRPAVTVKIASTLDGRIALQDGTSKWITGPRTRAYVHQLRAQHDAVMTASGTVRADDPSLTCRLAGYDAPQPLRVVVSSAFTLSPDSQLATTTDQGPVMVLAADGDPQFKGQDTVTEIPVAAGADGTPDPVAALETLGGQGITSVLVEAGGRFVASLMKAGVVDQLIWTRSSGVIGGDGLPSLSSLGLDDLAQGRIFRRVKSLIIDDDAIEIFRRR
ncbi:MAG: bifunctional diaminohydroxyphosphoribosylaminopyrimidine deaminase/5-amino-6-(5-phosphoribosylamino)uracil reductase RibD [Alphaproteobacteria bacterium]|nr:bifunctional diaminohydroxyphosphoribosylaminopyrimidine deaminase/5-amino-6-(5-phosphoribosylamino)uracil reductase RibD [Alphaproteobacteria bacterium]